MWFQHDLGYVETVLNEKIRKLTIETDKSEKIQSMSERETANWYFLQFHIFGEIIEDFREYFSYIFDVMFLFHYHKCSK